ncbi:putative DNA binding domain-containing protein [Phototrophicus methaneseepsis]|uniref:Putative DNA binding domain-containing protein n=1 Tax=Phototrophicus methaneseepsis TaxID=2710758 RepID=A0A7S8IDA2_9CHLR|nr:ATP-binding protein [Phototrophicus methaneseepsis]QPC80578.1 putative DNA binding domain-containing protein [Phototrophicus methaneseepsis]
MISVTDLETRFKQGRSTHFEWLPESAPQSELGEHMVAIANTTGGQIVLGISKEGQIEGVKNADDAIDRLIQAALAISPPLIIPVPQATQLGGADVVVSLIPPGLPSVYAYQGRFLQRDGTQNVALTPRDLRRLMLERGDLSFENEISQGATLDDLDWEKVTDYVKNLRGTGSSDEQIALIRRGCLKEQGGKRQPTNAGVLLFGKEPQRFIRGAEVTAVRFGGEAMSDHHSRQDIAGTLIDQIKRAETFLIDHLRRDVVLSEAMARAEQYEYPLEAARELVVNAVAHRDYSISGDTIRLFIFSNRMEVHSPGGLPGPITVENIKDERFSRNPIIVQVLADLNFIERLGYGVDRVIELMRQQNMGEPAFTERAGGFTVTLRGQSAQPQQEKQSQIKPPKDDVVFDGTYRGHAINPRQEAALMYLHKTNHTRITNSDLQQLFPDVHSETIRRDLVDLVSKDILAKMGQKRGSYYVLRRDADAAADAATETDGETVDHATDAASNTDNSSA